jgi:hypothetical protein
MLNQLIVMTQRRYSRFIVDKWCDGPGDPHHHPEPKSDSELTHQQVILRDIGA